VPVQGLAASYFSIENLKDEYYIYIWNIHQQCSETEEKTDKMNVEPKLICFLARILVKGTRTRNDEPDWCRTAEGPPR
jgi:hypothetical protein